MHKFKIVDRKDSQFGVQFLYNSEVMMWSESYKQKSSASNCIASIKKNVGDAALWDGGDILDPGNGKVYRVRLRPVDGGKKLEVRGFVGMPMLGRTQTWIRVE